MCTALGIILVGLVCKCIAKQDYDDLAWFNWDLAGGILLLGGVILFVLAILGINLVITW